MSSRAVFSDRSKYFVRRKAGNDSRRPIKPANGAISVNNNGRGRRSIAAGRRRLGMNHLYRICQFPIGIGQDDQVRKIDLGLPSVVGPFQRSDDDASIMPGKVCVTAFELTQLDHAGRSPPAAEEDEDVRLIAEEIGIGELCAVNP